MDREKPELVWPDLVWQGRSIDPAVIARIMHITKSQLHTRLSKGTTDWYSVVDRRVGLDKPVIFYGGRTTLRSICEEHGLCPLAVVSRQRNRSLEKAVEYELSARARRERATDAQGEKDNCTREGYEPMWGDLHDRPRNENLRLIPKWTAWEQENMKEGE